MPIRVNLKEIFPSDPQEINVEKLNFNFNKLLELGVGSPGPIGLTGPIGPAGPVGLVGPQGDRGATWWVDSGDPNLVIFSEPLVDGDMYLDQTSTVFQIWRYDEGTSTWNTVVSIAAIVNNYLSTASPSPFSTGPTGIPASNTKFVVFNIGDQVDPDLDYSNDFTRGAFNSSNNKSLLLANFNETVITPGLPLIWPANQNSLYTSLFKIVSAHDDAELSVKADLGRYHIELGSLYNDGTNVLLSDLKHNLKGKFYKRYIGLGSGELPLTNEWINTAKFSLSTPEPFTLVDVDQNGEFEFVVPKYNNESSLVREEVYVRIGSAEAFAERTNKAVILADGISITNDQVGRSMVVGLREDLGAVLNLPYSSTNFALFDVSDDVDGLFFNKTLVQTGGNIDQLITTPLSILNIASTGADPTGHYMNQGILVSSNTLIVSSGAGNTTSSSSIGTLARFDISDPTLLYKIDEVAGSRSTSALTPPYGNDQHGDRYLYNSSVSVNPNIGLIKDIGDYGKYIVSILGEVSGGSGDNFMIGEIDSRLNDLLITSTTAFTETLNGYRIQVNGKYAWVITNKTTVSGPQLSSGSPTYASLTAIDLSNPALPVVSDSYLETQPGTKYLDIKIADNKAYVLRYTNYVDIVTPANSIHSLDLLTFDILDPTSFSTLQIDKFSIIPSPGIITVSYSPADIQNLETLTVNTTRTEYGGLEVNGNDVYVCWEDNLYIIKIGTASTLISTTSLSSGTIYANDIKVVGKYAYVLVNYPSESKGAIQIYDIRKISSPTLCSETKETSLLNSSRLAIHGKNIYVVTTANPSRTTVVSLDLHGISSPSAEIGSLLASDLHISNGAVIRNNLHVKNSMNVGPGGVYIDKGQGLSSDGPIIANSAILTNISIDPSIPNIFNGGFGVALNNFTQTAITNNSISTKTNSFYNISSYDLLNIENTLFINGSGVTKYIRKGFLGHSITRIIGTQGYGHPSSPLTTAFTGSQISLGSSGFLGATDIMYGDLIGHTINLGPGVQLQTNDAYGYKFNFSGSSTGTVYGLYIEGADNNYIEGNVTLDDNIVLDGSSSRATNPSESISFDDVVYHGKNDYVYSSGYIDYSFPAQWEGVVTIQWIRVGNIVTVNFRGRLKNDTAADFTGSVMTVPHQGVNISLVEGHGHIQISGGSGSLEANSGFGNISVKVNSAGPSASVKLFHMNETTEAGLLLGDANKIVRGTYSYRIL